MSFLSMKLSLSVGCGSPSSEGAKLGLASDFMTPKSGLFSHDAVYLLGNVFSINNLGPTF